MSDDASDDSKPGSGNVSRHFASAILGNVFPPLAAIATAPILAVSLGVDGRGDVAAATAPLLLATTAATFGIPDAVTYAVARYPRVLRAAVARAHLLTFLTGLVATGIVVLAAGVLSGGDYTIQELIWLASIAIVPSLMIGVVRAAAMGLHRWNDVTASRILGAGLRLAAFAVLAATGTLTVFTAVVVIAVSPVVSGIVFLRTWRAFPARPEIPDALGSVNHLLGYGSRIWIGAISGVLLSRVDQILMVPLSSSYALGLYVVAVSISEVPLIVNSAVREVTFSSDAAQENSKLLGIASRLSTLATFVMAAAVGLTMGWWLPWLFGADFIPAIPVAIILLIAVTAGNPGSIAGAGLSARGRPGLRSWSLVVACVINLGLLVALVPALGAVGAGIATLVGNLVASNLNIYFLWRRFGVSPAEFYAFRISDLRLLAGTLGKVVRKFRRR